MVDEVLHPTRFNYSKRKLGLKSELEANNDLHREVGGYESVVDF